jgi:uncharacterized membrane protein
MEKMLVAVFDSETNAFEGVSAFKDLHKKGDITLFANAVVSVYSNGKLNIQQTADQGPIGTATGLFVGGLLGVIGGPVGLALGAGAGALAGLAFDVSDDSLNYGFVEEVTNKLTKGKSAVIAHIDEEWTVPVDTRLGELDGIVFRRLRSEVEDDQLSRESEAIVAEYNEWKEEMKEGIAADKAKMNKSLTNVKEKAQITKQQIEHKLNAVNNELNAKVDKMEQQMKHAGERRKARIQKRINELKEQYRIRTEKLKQASRLINEAFGARKENAALAETV